MSLARMLLVLMWLARMSVAPDRSRLDQLARMSLKRTSAAPALRASQSSMCFQPGA
jgi:hypothetical protein